MTRLTLAQVEAFYWIARLGSFHAAARQLCLTQPSVSGRIRELEADLTCRLFDRSGGKIRLTGAGKSLLPQAERMLSLAREIETKSPVNKLRGLLRLGVVETVAHLAVADLIRWLGSQWPDIRIELTIDVGISLLRKLGERELDVTITTDAGNAAGIREQTLGEIDLAWIGPIAHPLAGKVLSPADLVDQVVFAHAENSTIGRTITQWFDTMHLVPRRLSVCSSLSTTGELVAAGLGFSVMTPALLSDAVMNKLHRFEASPSLRAGGLRIAAHHETWCGDVEAIGDFVAQSLRRTDALK